MGAFLLFKQREDFDLSAAGNVFSKKGFPAPQELTFGSWNLWLYHKLLFDEGHNIYSDSGWSVSACGTVVYRGLGYRESLHRLLSDFRAANIDQEELLGSFCLLFWDGKTVSVLMDQSRTFHVFSNDAHTCISSSFLAVLEASPTPLPLNRLAVCEKMSTGYIVSPDTLVEGIQQVDGDVAETFSSPKLGIQFLPVSARPPVAFHDQGIDDSIARQISRLETHFRAMDALHAESHGDLGISSGYDSRLVLACRHFLSQPMALYTHGTKGVHDREAGIAKQIAKHCGFGLNQVATKRMENHSAENVAAILDDALYFQDGRCANMGAFSEVHTRSYKMRVIGKHHLGWNGLGGEMYRNYYFAANRSVNLRRWLDRHVYYPFASEAWGCSEEYEEMHRRKVAKLFHRLGEPVHEMVDFLWLRRYYSEIRMPDCNAVKNDAHNQVAFFHTPFMDATLVAEAINASPYIGCNGAYQARLIRTLDAGLAAIPSHYGHALDRIPLRPRLQAWVKCNLSEDIQRRRRQNILRQSATHVVPDYLAFSRRVPILNEIHDILCSTVLSGPLDAALIHYAQRPTALFIGSFLHAFQHKLRLGNI